VRVFAMSISEGSASVREPLHGGKRSAPWPRFTAPLNGCHSVGDSDAGAHAERTSEKCSLSYTPGIQLSIRFVRWRFLRRSVGTGKKKRRKGPGGGKYMRQRLGDEGIGRVRVALSRPFHALP